VLALGEVVGVRQVTTTDGGLGGIDPLTADGPDALALGLGLGGAVSGGVGVVVTHVGVTGATPPPWPGWWCLVWPPDPGLLLSARAPGTDADRWCLLFGRGLRDRVDDALWLGELSCWLLPLALPPELVIPIAAPARTTTTAVVLAA
jgi:hypothetical protein